MCGLNVLARCTTFIYHIYQNICSKHPKHSVLCCNLCLRQVVAELGETAKNISCAVRPSVISNAVKASQY